MRVNLRSTVNESRLSLQRQQSSPQGVLLTIPGPVSLAAGPQSGERFGKFTHNIGRTGVAVWVVHVHSGPIVPHCILGIRVPPAAQVPRGGY